MEAGIIANDNLARLEVEHQKMFNPGVENRRGAIAGKTARAKELWAAQRGNRRGAAGVIAGLLAIQPLTAWCPAALRPQVVINADSST